MHYGRIKHSCLNLRILMLISSSQTYRVNFCLLCILLHRKSNWKSLEQANDQPGVSAPSIKSRVQDLLMTIMTLTDHTTSSFTQNPVHTRVCSDFTVYDKNRKRSGRKTMLHILGYEGFQETIPTTLT